MKRFGLYSVLFIACLMVVAPYFMMIVCSFSTSASIKANNVFSDLSFSNFIINFESAIHQKNFFRSILNSLIVSSISSLMGAFWASLAVYSYNFNSSKLLSFLLLITIIPMYIPTASILIPIFLMFRYINLNDTYFSLIVTSMNIPFLVFLIQQNAKNFSNDVIKAARMDGANEFRIYYRIFIPGMKTVFITAIIFSFFEAWNSVLIPVVLLQSPDKFTNSILLNSIGSIWYSDYAMLMMSLVLSTLPTFLIFVIFRYYLKKHD